MQFEEAEPTYDDVRAEEKIWNPEDIHTLHAKGYTNMQISQELGLAPNLVGRHIRARAAGRSIKTRAQYLESRLKRIG